MSRTAPKIKNRAPAPIQISAEQLLREAQERQEAPAVAPVQRIEDYEELEEHRGRRRTEFEDRLRRARSNMSMWIKYATWEASQGEMDRCRSVYERALDFNPHHLPLWLRYTEQELKMRNVQHARNLYDRAVSILPRIDQLWYKYVHLEELLGNVSGTRQVFERWMKWEPEEKAWAAYIKLETRYGELDRASSIWERAVTCHPTSKQWIRWAKFEEDRGDLEKARMVFQMALDYIGEDEDAMEKAQSVFTAFAKMETRLKEYERARVIYKYALERLPRSKSEGIYSSYTRFEKQFGTMSSVDDTVIGKRRIQYEEELAAQSTAGTVDYDTWFDYTRLEEDVYRTLAASGGSTDQLETATKRVREVYERAVAGVPSSTEKRDWRRYIFLWLRYALFEEIEIQDYPRVQEIYKAAIAIVPHRTFTFAKLWVQYARFLIRRLDLSTARKTLGTAIGMAPKLKLFNSYIDIELSLKEFDRARKIYEKALEWDPSNSQTWVKFAELEKNLFDTDRARGLFELGVEQAEMGEEGLDMPEIVWKAYIDFEFEEREWERVDGLYERLLERSGHVKVWISFALSKVNQATAMEEDEDQDEDDDEQEPGDDQQAKPSRKITEEEQQDRAQRKAELVSCARSIFNRAYESLKSRGLKDERVTLLEAWKMFERTHGSATTLSEVESKLPRVVKKRRELADGSGIMEEYYDMIFPDDQEKDKGAFKLLQMAHAWRAAQAAKQQQEQQQQQKEPRTEEEAGEGQEGMQQGNPKSISIEMDGDVESGDDADKDNSGEDA
ncbi:probable protein CCN1 - putative cell cycle control protein [Melanopsichium pennsylvanicum]|uniref:Probable protein CCN1 - putative cell cycle control protein n=2 Tax=Melanopsichium pennsylvanicum TaxID=63383 RepID=A0AAJ4XL71_9BASI|nr:probable protein CCN1-putative cell cycle control protein [Melanopsichium pennsylvanicum 4]SNX84394.1 probable protein CCN1 - putative cell cycle control protein [Melanopsichium pennsylvanicum]